MSDFKSGFAADLEGMIAFKTALGYAESTYLERSKKFDFFCAENHPEEAVVTEGLAISWLRMDESTSSGVIHDRASFVRLFAQYQKANGKNAFVWIGTKVYKKILRQLMIAQQKTAAYHIGGMPLFGSYQNVTLASIAVCITSAI
jgi:hypothetical protein